jgi:erythrin-vacuolar iron transport family protein
VARPGRARLARQCTARHGQARQARMKSYRLYPRRAAELFQARRKFILETIQPALIGLMDGSVSTLAPIFASAFATHRNIDALLVGLAASLGAGISMGFSEALADDGILSGRGSPLMRGSVCGLATAVGGLGHTLPFLVPDTWPHAFWTAISIAAVVVALELFIIVLIRWHYMQTPFLRAAIQVLIGGSIVALVGVLLGSG